jgi:2-octaprenylphenol hydroxylase
VSASVSDAFDAVVVGAGIVGAALALELVGDRRCRRVFGEARPLRLAVLEPKPPPPDPVDPGLRTVALSPAHFDRLRARLDDDGRAILDAHVCPYGAMEVWDGEGGGRVRFEARELGAAQLGWIVPNAVLQQQLYGALERAPVTLFAGAGLAGLSRSGDATRWQLQLDGSPGTAVPEADANAAAALTAPLVIGADGARSRLAGLLGIEARTHPYAQQALACTATFEAPHEGVARQAFLRTGPLALLPLPGDGGRRCSIVWSLDGDGARELGALDASTFGARLAAAAGHCLGAVTEVSARAAFPLQGRHVRRYTGSGWALLGDAAHVIHPLAGLGVNLGLRDGAVLAGQIAALAGRRHARPEHLGAPAWLARYERGRRAENEVVLQALGLLKTGFGIDAPWLHWARNAGMRLVDRSDLARRLFATEALGVRDRFTPA